MLACFPLSLSPSSPPLREESGPKGIVGTSKKQERTNGASTLEHVAPRSNPCPFLSSCDHMRLASWLHFVYKCTSSPAKPAAGGYFEARPFNEKGKKEKKNKKKRGEFPTPLSSPLCLVRSWVSHPPDCQTANTEKSLNLFFLQCNGGYSYVAW